MLIMKEKINYIRVLLFMMIFAAGVVFAHVRTTKTVQDFTIPFLNPTSHVITKSKVVEVMVDYYQLDYEMTNLFNYIKTKNRRVPIEVVKIIAWEIVNQARNSRAVTVDLLTAIIETESTFSPMVRSSAGAKGLMQILIETGIDIDPNRVYDIKYNIQTGISIFESKLKKSKGNINLALRYYVGDKHTNKYPTKVERRRKNYNQFLKSKG